MTSDTHTFIHKLKCLHCSLHFIVYSYHEDWKPIVCPECTARIGFDGNYLHWRSSTTQQVFEFVPGKSTLVFSTNPTDN